MKLKGKTVLVTGGTKGIGRAIVEAVASEGANVLFTYKSDKKSADEVESIIKKHGVEVVTVQADVANSRDIDNLVKEIRRHFKNVDVLINNAGIFVDGDSPDNMKAFEEVYETNFFAQLRVTNAIRPLMKQGKIIFISSIHGKLGNGRPNAIAYSSSKAALDSYMKNLAKALAPDILVNAIAPGRTITPMWGDMSEEYKAKQAADQLIQRWIEPNEIADGAVFLAKNDAVCGEVLVIDGGLSLKVLG